LLACIAEAEEEAGLILNFNDIGIIDTVSTDSTYNRSVINYFTILKDITPNKYEPDSPHEHELAEDGSRTIMTAIRDKKRMTDSDHFIPHNRWYIWISVESYLEIAMPKYSNGKKREYNDRTNKSDKPDEKHFNNNLYYGALYRTIEKFNNDKKNAFIAYLKN